jgi:hypothetical protein
MKQHIHLNRSQPECISLPSFSSFGRCHFETFRNVLQQAVDKWLRSNPGRYVTQVQASSLLSEGHFFKAVAILKAADGFGQLYSYCVWPVHRSMFSENYFKASEILNTVTFIMKKHVAVVQHRLEQINSYSAFSVRFEKLKGTKNVAVDFSPSIMKPVLVYNISSFPKAKVHYGKRKQMGAQWLLLLVAQQGLYYACKIKIKNKKELERQGKQVEKGSLKRRDTATKEVGGEVNREEWYCASCEETVSEDMVCCHHYEK